MRIDWSKYKQVYPTGMMRNFKKQREILGIEIKDIASYADITVQQYKQLESGKKDITDTSFYSVMCICKLLEIDPCTLLL